MIGLAGLANGGHVLEHPAGPLYVLVRRHSVVYAELAPWGSPHTERWNKRQVRSPQQAASRWQQNLNRGGDAAAQV